MKEKIKEVQEYFKSKIINGDYDIKKLNDGWYDIIIDDEYYFTIYYNKEGKVVESLEGTSSFMRLGGFNSGNKITGYKNAISRITYLKENELSNKKLKQYEELKAELTNAKLI
jgi:hypothetical protein